MKYIFLIVINLNHRHYICTIREKVRLFVTLLLDFCVAMDDTMCKYMEVFYESVLHAKKIKFDEKVFLEALTVSNLFLDVP
jgi:hypothetical protein